MLIMPVIVADFSDMERRDDYLHIYTYRSPQAGQSRAIRTVTGRLTEARMMTHVVRWSSITIDVRLEQSNWRCPKVKRTSPARVCRHPQQRGVTMRLRRRRGLFGTKVPFISFVLS